MTRNRVIQIALCIILILCFDLIRWIPWEGARLPDAFESAALEYKVNEDLLRAVAHVENESGNPAAVSKSGAIGIMQIMPATGEWACGLSRAELFDRTKNIKCGALYLSYLDHRIRAKYGERLDLVLAAYNAGPGNVDRYRGVPPFPETRRYIAKVHAKLKEIQNDRENAQSGN